MSGCDHMNKSFTVPVTAKKREDICDYCGRKATIFIISQLGRLCQVCYEKQSKK